MLVNIIQYAYSSNGALGDKPHAPGTPIAQIRSLSNRRLKNY